MSVDPAAPSTEHPMPPLLRRLLLLFHALRYGARLIWLAAPPGHKLHWMVELLGRVHASGRSVDNLHGLLPALGPLATRFAQTLAQRPELAGATLHDAIDAVDHMEAPLPPRIRAAAAAPPCDRPRQSRRARSRPQVQGVARASARSGLRAVRAPAADRAGCRR